MIIHIHIKHALTIADTQEEFMGAPIDDADEGSLWLVVEPEDVDIDCRWWQVKEPYEFWGQKGSRDMTEYEIHSCTWNGYDVVNDDEVFEKKELNLD
jgi:hypothetical protein